MDRRAFLSIALGAGAGCASSSDPATTATSTQTRTATPTPSSRNLARQATREGLNDGDAWSDGVREISLTEQADAGDLLSVRYTLQTSFLNGADDAEQRAGFTARAVLLSVAETRLGDQTEVAIYAYVPTEGGDDTVSTKVVMTLAMARSINWERCAWECIPETAEQYKFNRYLYE